MYVEIVGLRVVGGVADFVVVVVVVVDCGTVVVVGCVVAVVVVDRMKGVANDVVGVGSLDRHVVVVVGCDCDG